MRRLFLGLCIALLALPAWAQTARLLPRILEAPWREALVSVRDIETTAKFFIDVAGYETVASGELTKEQLEYWRLPEKAEASFLLLREPGSSDGYIRLVSFKNVRQQPIRIGARAWDTGGYFSLMFRGKDVQSLFDQAIALGWQAESEPIRFQFPPSDLKNVVLKGPDGINIAIYERISPMLEGFPEFESLSQPFNAMQMVKNVNIAHSFFRDELGMKSFWEGDFVDPLPTYNNFGLPQNLSVSIPRSTRILWPQPGETGRLELMEFVGLDGRDLSLRASPPNLGILSVSYPVKFADRAYEKFRDAGGLPKYSLRTFDWPPYGRVRMFTVQSPDGALVDIFNVIEGEVTD